MTDRDLIDRLRSAEWPAPSPELRARIATTAVKPGLIAWSDRVWYSRTWRVGMAATAIACLVLDYSVPPVRPLVTTTASETAETRTVEELVLAAGLPQDFATVLARRSFMTPQSSARDRAALITGEDR